MEKNPILIVLAASAFATHKQRDQRREGADASLYISYPITVANILATEAGLTGRVALAAVLRHDA